MEGRGMESKPPNEPAKRSPTIKRAGIEEHRHQGRSEGLNGRKRSEPKLVPLEHIPAARGMVLKSVHAPRAEIHAMSELLQRDYPGRKPGDIWDAFRRVRDDRGAWNGKHVALSEVEIAILRGGYAAGPTDARAARKEVLRRRPGLNRNQLDWIVRQLKLGTRRAPAERWSPTDHGFLMFWSQEKDIKHFVTRLRRTEAAIRARLSRYGASARLRTRRGYTVREAAALLGVSRTSISRWVAEGQLRTESQRNVHAISEDALRGFCKRHPAKVDTRLCSPKVLPWLPKAKGGRPFSGRRGHLGHAHTCEKCGRTIRGNGYSNHVKVCGLDSESSGSNM